MGIGPFACRAGADPLIFAWQRHEEMLHGASDLKETHMSMTWGTFGQIVLLIVVFAVVKTFVRCMHDTYCKKCKPQ